MAISTMTNSFTTTATAAILALGLIVAQPAAAGGAAAGWARSSTVTDSVVNNGNGTWTYGYTVNNTSQLSQNGQEAREPILVDWEMSWFGDAGITNITSPNNWDWSIETIGVSNGATGWAGVAAWQDPADSWYAGANSPFTAATQVLHWFNTCWVQQPAADVTSLAAVNTCEGMFDNAVFQGNSLSGFGFTADFDATAAPYQASWAVLPVRTGDPAFPGGGIPNSPLVQGAQGVPEPGMLGLLGIGMIALALGRRRRG